MSQVVTETTRPSGHKEKKNTRTPQTHADPYTAAAVAK